MFLGLEPYTMTRGLVMSVLVVGSLYGLTRLVSYAFFQEKLKYQQKLMDKLEKGSL